MKGTVADSFGNGRKKRGFEDFPTKCLVRANDGAFTDDPPRE
jgi:hypothetical protein